jgi:pSer/pThr/pTyr-binding forkhead associated (FHA) protein
MRPTAEDYAVEDEDGDPPTLRARPTWVSSDENKDLIQKEIILEAFQSNYFSIGRSMKREVQIKLKAVSADHCNIQYDKEKGWYISERGKDKLSSNGTFVFMKSHKQMSDHEPSDLIPLHDGMVISFINYEIRVNLEKKDPEEIANEELKIKQLAEEFSKTASFAGTFKASAEPAVEEQAEPEAVAPVEETPAPEEKAAVEEQPVEEVAKEVAPAEEVVAAPVEEPKVEEAAPVEEQKAEEPAPAQEAASADDKPAEASEAAKEPAPEEKKPVEQAAAAEEAPKDEEKAAEEAPKEEAKPAEEAPKEEE